MTTPTATTRDAIDAILGVEAGSAIARLRAAKPALAEQVQAYDRAVFEPAADSAAAFPLADRAVVAVRVAAHTGSAAVADRYAAVGREAGADPAALARARDLGDAWPEQSPLAAAVRHADLLTARPASARREDLAALKAAGFSPAGILALSQTIAFVSYQIRLIAALRALGEPATDAAPTPAARSTPGTAKPFTLDLLDWSPWVERATETDLAPAQRARVEAHLAGTPNPEYLDVLANDFGALQARAKVHRHVYTSEEPRPTAFRELAATAASRVNGCVYCAAVHARMFAAAAGDRALAQRFLDDGIAAELPPAERAVVDLAAKLTVDPEAVSAADLAPLRKQGFDDLAILDAANYAAFFANANRLMLSLGEPRPRPRRGAA